MNLKYIFTIVLAALLGLAIGYASKPAELQIKEVRIKGYVNRTEIDNDRHVVVTEERKPDGTVTRREETIDKSKERSETHTREDVTSERVQRSQSNWSVGAYYEPSFVRKAAYMLAIDRRIVGNVWAGAYVRTTDEFKSSTFGLGVRLTF